MAMGRGFQAPKIQEFDKCSHFTHVWPPWDLAMSYIAYKYDYNCQLMDTILDIWLILTTVSLRFKYNAEIDKTIVDPLILTISQYGIKKAL